MKRTDGLPSQRLPAGGIGRESGEVTVS